MTLHVSRRFWAVALITITTLVGTADANPIQFSFTGTADASQYGYVAGESYTFDWTVNSGFTNNENCYFVSDDNFWTDDLVSEAPIFTDFSGDGLTGSWQRPVSPWSFLEAWDRIGTQRLELYAGTDQHPHYPIGLKADGTDIVLAYAMVEIGNIFSFPGSYMDPNEYFADYTGTYTPAAGGYVELFTADLEHVYFTPTSVTISQIPEPASGVLIMFATSGLVFIRKRLVM